MKFFQLLNKIDNHATKVYDKPDNYSNSHDEFLKMCKESLTGFFSAKYSEKFIFSSLSYINTDFNKEDVKLVKENENHNGFFIAPNSILDDIKPNKEPNIHNISKLNKKQKLKILFDAFILEISNKSVISLTQFLLNRKNSKGIVLCTGYEISSENLNHPQQYNLDFKKVDIDWNSFIIDENSLNKYIENKKNDIKTLFEFFDTEIIDDDIKPYALYLLRYLEIAKLIGPNVFIYFIKPSTIEFKHNLLLSIALTKPIAEEDLTYINLIMHRIVSQTEIERGVELKKKSNITALSSVMSRNASHNIGSHVLSRLIDPSELDSQRILEDFQYKPKLFDEENIDIEEEKIKKINELNLGEGSIEYKKIIGDFIRQNFANKRIANFNSYLKSRQDFLAEIASTPPQIQNTKWLKKDVLRGLDDNRILLNRISGISKFDYIIETDIFIGDNADDKDDIEVAISNDLMGQHAFYVIIENIIRNTAKHSGKSDNTKDPNKQIVFTIRVRESELDSSLYKITIFDTVKISDNCVPFDVPKHYYEKYYEEWKEGVVFDSKKNINSLTGKIKKIDKLIIDQNEKINRPILSNSELRTEALGLVEMEACAAYLRRIPVEEIEDNKFEIKFKKKEREDRKIEIRKGNIQVCILRAVNPFENPEKDKTTRKNVLGYRFYLPKPKELLIIDDIGCWRKLLENNTKNEIAKKQRLLSSLKNFERKGILVVFTKKSSDGMDKDLFKKHLFNSNESYPHEQLLVWTEKADFAAINEEYAGLISEEKERITIKDYLLPKRFIFKNNFLEEFNCFYSKEFELAEYISENNIKEVNLEVLRAIVRGRYIRKNLYFNEGENRLLELSKKNNEYYIDDSLHGVNKLQPNHYNLIYSSRNKFLVDSFTTTKSSKKNKDFNKLNTLKHFDDAINNILVLDERIQEKNDILYSLESTGNDKKNVITIKNVWDNVNVYLPSIAEINLQEKNYKPNYAEKITKIIKNQFIQGDRVCKGLDYIIIHLGVIEKILTAQNKDKEDNPEKIKLLKDILFDLKIQPHIVITSGRAPKNLPSCYSFITFSTTSQYLIENRLKYLLNEMLNASRPKFN